jgi:hypothetical protein
MEEPTRDPAPDSYRAESDPDGCHVPDCDNDEDLVVVMDGLLCRSHADELYGEL